jgi:ketosteroid isomerase-like protein
VASYEAAMNASNTDALIALYAEDGVLMPPYTHSVVGQGSRARGICCRVQGLCAAR